MKTLVIPHWTSYTSSILTSGIEWLCFFLRAVEKGFHNLHVILAPWFKTEVNYELPVLRCVGVGV